MIVIVKGGYIMMGNDNNVNNDINNDALKPSIENKKTQTFNLIIGVATLLIAIFGATFAYFTATARSEQGEVTVKSAMISISFERGTEIKAENLIPSTQSIMLKKYMKEQELPVDHENGYTEDEFERDYDAFVNSETFTQEELVEKYADRKCIDAKGKEVCYVFWFSVTSDAEDDGGTTDILSYITVNRNEFQNLSYLAYEVDYKEDSVDNTKIVKDKYGFGVVESYGDRSGISDYVLGKETVTRMTGTNTIEEPVPYGVFKNESEIIEDGTATGSVYPVACLFGEVADADQKAIDDTTRCNVQPIKNGKTTYFQIVIWLEETGTEQLEQGKTFAGTVSVEVSGGSGVDGYENGRVTGRD